MELEQLFCAIDDFCWDFEAIYGEDFLEIKDIFLKVYFRNYWKMM
jgi:hypothetical protein